VFASTTERVCANVIIVHSPEDMLAAALAKLEAAGGKEEESDDDDDAGPPSKAPHEYLNELLALGYARYRLGQYEKAGSLFYRAYYVSMHDPRNGGIINHPSTFPVAHKMIQAWSKSEQDHYSSAGPRYGRASHYDARLPPYIFRDVEDAAKALRKKGLKVLLRLRVFT
jgi:tetratricopeptide (TPR) repeat protein